MAKDLQSKGSPLNLPSSSRIDEIDEVVRIESAEVRGKNARNGGGQTRVEEAVFPTTV